MATNVTPFPRLPTAPKNIDEKSGTVQLWSGKNKTYDSYPLKQMDPQLFNKLVALKKGKNPDDLLFTTKNNTSISNAKFNLILRDLTCYGTIFGIYQY